MGRWIKSKAQYTGRNYDVGPWRDDKYVRCSRCGWINNLDRDVHSNDGGYEGWGTSMNPISANSSGNGFSTVNQAAPVVTMSLVGSQIHGSWVWPSTLTTGVTTVQVAYTSPSPVVFTTITTNYAFLSNGIKFVDGKPWYSYSISTPAASWTGGTLLISVLIPSTGATSPVNAGLQTQGYDGQVLYSSSIAATDILTNTYGSFSFNQGNIALLNGIPIPAPIWGNDNDTELLLPLNDNVTDISQNALPVTNTAVTFANTTPVFPGTYYGVFNGTSATLSIANSTSFTFGTGDFTEDLWINPSSLANNAYVFLQGYLFSQMFLLINTNGSIEWKYTNSASTTLADYSTPAGSIVANVWQHIAIVRNGSNFYIFVNGVSKALTVNTAIGTNNLSDTGITFVISAYGGGVYYKGNMSEVRISKGIARWTSNFTPPPLTYSNNIVMMLLFNGQIYAINNSSQWFEYTGTWTYVGVDPRTQTGSQTWDLTTSYDSFNPYDCLGPYVETTMDAVVGGGCAQCGTFLYDR